MKNNTFKNKTHLEVGVSGEDAALYYLRTKGFDLVARNVRYKWGEIDLVMKNGSKVHFIEVKTRFVTRETWNMDVRPEHNMTQYKIRKTLRSVEAFLATKWGRYVHDWQIDLMAVVLRNNCPPKIEWYKNIVL